MISTEEMEERLKDQPENVQKIYRFLDRKMDYDICVCADGIFIRFKLGNVILHEQPLFYKFKEDGTLEIRTPYIKESIIDKKADETRGCN